MRIALVLVLGSLFTTALPGQTPEGQPIRRARRLTLALERGGSLGGPAAGLAAQLRAAGFDDTSPPAGCFIWWCTGTPHPRKQGPGLSADITAHFAVSGTLAVAAGYGWADLGGSLGYRAVPGSVFGGESVHSVWEATMGWVAAFWRPPPPPSLTGAPPPVPIRLGAGPAWYRLQNINTEVSRLGLMVEAGAEPPANRRFFLNLAARVHLIPSRDVEHPGPVVLRPRWTHASLLLGGGVRL